MLEAAGHERILREGRDHRLEPALGDLVVVIEEQEVHPARRCRAGVARVADSPHRRRVDDHGSLEPVPVRRDDVAGVVRRAVVRYDELDLVQAVLGGKGVELVSGMTGALLYVAMTMLAFIPAASPCDQHPSDPAHGANVLDPMLASSRPTRQPRRQHQRALPPTVSEFQWQTREDEEPADERAPGGRATHAGLPISMKQLDRPLAVTT